ncbi:MAG: ribonuclease III [Oscillospiraceae bacterium]|nr:ribonuclease III [Oscillospiraceae bacterium]
MIMLDELEQALGYSFLDRSLLENALRHSSYANERRKEGLCSNERLEFLGDSILGFVTAEYLYRMYPDHPEGDLTRMRAELVCEGSLADVAERLRLGRHLMLGHGEEQGGGRTRSSINADAVESVLAAVYLDGGFEPVRALICRLILEKARVVPIDTDYKTMLQELVQREKNQTLKYCMVSESGPDHDKAFRVIVLLNDRIIGDGEGRSKKRAEQAAAEKAILFLKGT